MPRFGFGRKDKDKDKKKHHQEQPAPAQQNGRKQNGPPERYVPPDDSARRYTLAADPNPPNSNFTRLVSPVSSKQAYPSSRDSTSKVSLKAAYYEELAKNSVGGSTSPEKRRLIDAAIMSGSSSSTSRISVSVTTTSPHGSGSRTPSIGGGANTPISRTASGGYSASPEPSIHSQSPSLRPSTTSGGNKRDSYLSLSALEELTSSEGGKDKVFTGVDLPLPPLQMTTVRHRVILAEKTEGQGFGFILRQSYLPVPDDPERTCLVHLIEPRADYMGPLMTGDRIIEVNEVDVEDEPHEAVVEMIKSSGDSVELKVASMPELLELNARGALDDQIQPARSNPLRRSGRAKPATGTLRKQAKNVRKAFKAKTAEEVLSEKVDLEQERVWVVHSGGFTLGTLVQDTPGRRSQLSSHVSFIRLGGRETHRVKLQHNGEVLEIDEEDLEKANPSYLSKVEDVVDLVHLNEPSLLHVLRQRYGSSLIHTFAGRHLIVLNPLKPLSSYVDRVIDMFRGCRREDMPPHIFAMGQQAYRSMMVTRQDQSLILMGLSGSGKTFNARYLLRYLTTVGQVEHGPVTNAKLDAVELLLHSFGSSATFLNPQATRCSCLYTLDFDPSGTVVSALVRTFLLEKFRIANSPPGEGNFNILYQLVAGADDQLKSDLLLFSAVPEDSDEPNHFFEPYEDPQRVDSATYVWHLIQNCLEILGITQEEAHGLWCLLAAVYHLGFAGVRKAGGLRGSDCFLNPAAAQRAASVLGINHEELGRNIFNPPRGASMRLSNLFNTSTGSSPSPSETTSIQSSSLLSHITGSRSMFLDAFVMGLYDHAFNALVMLINRALQPSAASRKRSSIHVLDTPGFQHRELAGARDGASFDDLCINYAQERLQMLFHDFTFTSEQDRYMQEEINWMFSEVAASPLPVIDTIDKHVPQRRGGAVDLHTDRRGLLWILDEESVFPGASDSSFLDRLHMYHGDGGGGGGGGCCGDSSALVNVIKEDNQFTINHYQKSLSVLYDANGWVRRAREHPAFKVVVQVLAESKRPSIVSIFQGRGVAASATTLGNTQLKADSHRTLTRTSSSQPSHYTSPAASIKKSSVCLQTKFQLDFLIDLLRKSMQWYIRCILPQLPHRLPGALPSPDPELSGTAGDVGGVEQLPVTHGHINVSLVRDQIRRAELVKAARIYKQGFPEHVLFSEFRRRYSALLSKGELVDAQLRDKDMVEFILTGQDIDPNTYRIGLSQVFFRAGTLSQLDRQVEDITHDTMVAFQARCRGWLGRCKSKQLEVQHSAALVIQQNVDAYMEVREWSWWELFITIKPKLAVWRAEEDIKEKDSQITKLKANIERLENENEVLKEAERTLEEKMTQMSSELEDVHLSASQASEIMEGEQLERRELEEKVSEIQAHESELIRENEQLQLQIAEMSILARIKQEEGGAESSDAVLEKYYQAQRELESLRQSIATEHEDQVEILVATKRSLEKKFADSQNEVDDLHKTLSQVRKKAAKLGSEMNDLKLHLESQQARNAELEKRQRKFDADLSAAKDEASSEIMDKEKLAREKDTLHTELADLQRKIKELEEENFRSRQEKEDLEAEVLAQSSLTADSELTSLKKMKRELESKVEELEEELDEVNIKLDTLQQNKARLELANQTMKQQHQKELEGREEELEQVKSTMSKKLKAVSQQLEEMHEEKQSAVKARRELERDLLDYQSRVGDPETEKKLKKQVRKYKTLLQDVQDELEHEREMRGNSAMMKSLRNQLDDLQASESTAIKAQKRLQDEVDDLVVQNDELSRAKTELELRVNDLGREKSDLEGRVEEDQDEIEELLSKQRMQISQLSSLQSQLTETNLQAEELQDAKQTLESKVDSLLSKIMDMESGINRQQYEASELKVRELEQKLELERSSARRHEAQISRLRSQLERLQEDKSEEVTHKSSDAMKRMQKQVRELRSELQEAERRELELNKKKRVADTTIEELEAKLKGAQSDLKSAQKRIDTLHGALKGQEDYSGSSMGEEEYSLDQSESLLDEDGFSSSDSSYKVGEYDINLSSEGDEDFESPRIPRREVSGGISGKGGDGGRGSKKSPLATRRRRHSSGRSAGKTRSSERSKRDTGLAGIGDNEEKDNVAASPRRKAENSDLSSTLSNARSHREGVGSEEKHEEDDLLVTRRNRKIVPEEDDSVRPSRSKLSPTAGKLSDEDDEDLELLTKRGHWRDRIKLSDSDEDLSSTSRTKKGPSASASRQTRLNSDEDDDKELDYLTRRRREQRARLSSEEIDDLRSSSRNPATEDASPQRDSNRSREKGTSPFTNGTAVTSPRHTSSSSKGRREENPEGVDLEEQAAHAMARSRRRRQRRRTVEAEKQISPEHSANVAK